MDLTAAFKKLSPSLYRLRILVIIIAALVLPIAIYYFLYVRSQTGYFTDRRFRRLSLITSQIASKVESAGSVLKSTSEKFIRPEVQEESSGRFDANVTRKQNLEQLKELFKRLKDDSPQIIPVNIGEEPWSVKASPGSVTLTATRQEYDSSWLYFDYISEGLKQNTVIRVQAKTDLNRLLQPFLSARIGSDPDQFQNILIAEADTAKVIYQHDPAQVRLASLEKLSASENAGKKIDLKEIAQTSNVVDVALAGINYRLFSHPLKLSLPSSSASEPNISWMISGLVKSNYFQTEAWSISVPYKILIIGGFVVALLVFGWPFFKLVLAGPKDRFRTYDVYLLVFGTLVVLAVVTSFILYAYVYLSLERQMDEQVEGLAKNIKTNFDAELVRALRQLDKLSQNRELLKKIEPKPESTAKTVAAAKSPTTAKVEPSGKSESDKTKSEGGDQILCHDSGVKNDIYSQKCKNNTNILPDLLSAKAPYPYFDTTVWMDETGMQKAKWTVKPYTTQYISASGRAYFDNIRSRHFYELDNHKFWLEPIISRTTGRSQVEISKAVPDSTLTLAFDTRLLSLMDPVLPDSFGFVIIENDGKVLFHSDEAHHLGENLLQECDEDRALRSAVIGRSDRSLDVRYLGEDYHFFVTTLNGFPEWSLIVFRNKQPLRSIFFELLTSVTALFLVYGFILIAGFTVFYILYARNKRRAWLWPSKKKRAIYIQSFFLLLGFVLVSLGLTIFLHGEKLVWLVAGIALLGALAFFMNLRFGPRLWPARSTTVVESARSTFKYDRIYTLNATLLLLLIAILPNAAFFKYEYESETSLLIKHAQFTMATALAKRDERIRSQYANIVTAQRTNSGKPEEAGTNGFMRQRLGETWDIYDQFFFETYHANSIGEEKHKETAQTDLLSRLSTVLPLSNRTSIERRGLLDNAAVDGLCTWQSNGIGRLILHLDGNAERQGSWPWLYLNTAVPLLGVPGLPWLGIFILFYPFFLGVNFIVRKVFLLDIRRPTSHSLKKFLSGKIDRNVFVVANAPFVNKKAISASFKESSLYLTDLRTMALSPDWAEAFDDKLAGEGAVIALDQFDYRMDDPQTNQQKLKLLERLLGNQRTLIIFSSNELSQYRFEKGGNGQANGEHDESDRWAGVIIRNFFTEYAEDTDDGLSFGEIIDREKMRILDSDLQEPPRKKIEILFDTLYAECARREPLQHVGLQILEHKGFLDLSRQHLLGRIVNQARAYYKHIWDSCSPGEKQTLCHLAQDRMLSHRDPDIANLLRRQLIIGDEGLHLFSESFRQFVQLPEQLASVAEDDAEASKGSLWQILKVPILVTLMAIAAFLFVTQQDLFSSSLALVTGVTTIITALFKVLSMFHVDPVGRPASQG